MAQLLIATSNIGKQKEISSLLYNLDVELLTPAKLGLNLTVKEDGVTYQENAALKAVAFTNATGQISLADDTGLEVDALSGAPGLFSARYAPEPNATDADRRAHLLTQLDSLPKPWKARFCCAVAIASAAGILGFFYGECLGEIMSEEKGSHGFGYDPIFYISSVGKTMAELTLDEKNHISHRAVAIKKAIPLIRRTLVDNKT